jgi:beta-fructofuranosidase
MGGDIVKHWGHATSTDLYSWVDLPIAIPASARDGSIFSGSIVVDKNNTSDLFPKSKANGEDNIIAYYTSWQPEYEVQHMAFSHNGGVNFTQYPYNPIINLDRHGFRDPKVSFHHPTGKWIMALTLENAVTFYTSTNLRNWKQVSIWNPGRWLGVIECPQILEIPVRDRSGNPKGSKWVLTLSLAGGGLNGGSAVKYVIGSFDGTDFIPDPPTAAQRRTRDLQYKAGLFDHRLFRAITRRDAGYSIHDIDFGPDKYATAFFHILGNNDASHDAYSVSWATDSSYGCCTPTDREGWRHCMNGIRQHWIDSDSNKLFSVPAGDTAKLASQNPGWNPIIDLRGIAGLEGNSSVIRNYNPAVEWFLTIRVQPSLLKSGQKASAQLLFQSSKTGNAETVSLKFDFAGVSTKKSSTTPEVAASITLGREGLQGWDMQGAYPIQDIEALRMVSVDNADGSKSSAAEYTLRGILDRSILEVYVNGGIEAGTLLYFADGVMDSITVKRGGSAADQGVEFDFKAVALKSGWTGETVVKGSQSAPSASEWTVGEL